MESTENPKVNTVTIQVPTTTEIAEKRSFIPIAFGAAIAFFFFSFCDLKCANGQHLASVSGINMVLGTSVKNPDTSEGQNIPPNLWAILAFGAAIVGVVIFLKRHPKEALIGTGAGAVGTVSMLLLRASMGSQSEQIMQMQVFLIIKPAFWLAMLSFIVAGSISFLRYRTKEITPPQSASYDSEGTLIQEGLQENQHF